MLSYRVEKSISLDLGGTTTEVVDVVTLESDKVAGAV